MPVKGQMNKKREDSPKVSAQYLRDRDHQQVRGQFHFHEAKGSKLRFGYRKYKEDDVEYYTIEDNEIRFLPYMVVEHLNTTGWIIKHKHQVDKAGKPYQKEIRSTRRYSFENLDFLIGTDYETNKSIVEINEIG